MVVMVHGSDDDKHSASSSTVIEFNADTFTDAVPKKPHFIMFYAPWCGHCKRLSPTWEDLGKKYNTKEGGLVAVGKVDCTQHSALCSTHDVTGYPTLKLIAKGHDGGVRYRGARDLASLERFIAEQVGSDEESGDEGKVPEAKTGLVEYTEATFKANAMKGKHFIKFYAPWCGHCQRLAPTWEALAKSFEHDDSVTIGKVDCTQYQSVCSQYEVKGYPTLLWLSDGKKIKKYSGDRSHEDLKRFAESMLGQEEGTEGGDSVGTQPESPTVILTAENFENAIQKGFTLVKFFAPWCGHCKRMAPTYDELGRKFVGHDSVTIGKVDCTQEVNRALCSQQNVNGFPTLYLYNEGEKVSEYEGDRSLQDMAAFVSRHLTHDEL
ncbi:hypothetical protein Pmani_015047 [Petrolisthes manimaculis]|uniref:Thioredoxin domain-containing protein n=1 Tax=Petrolisthes manimaculis TaxID=1843537 RepID=A0AAE1PSP6_9EUCA|nr:hypothetical protein Pmani_015047 [Petrolisthes manimaculis]